MAAPVPGTAGEDGDAGDSSESTGEDGLGGQVDGMGTLCQATRASDSDAAGDLDM